MKSLPEAALQQHIAVLGKTGSGKTFAAKAVIVEPLLSAGRRVGIVDPTDAWWGLRSSRDGKGAGFPMLVLGGDHGDLPLPAAGGAAVARLLVEQGVNLVASTKHLTVGERTRWFIDFAGTLSRLNRAPLHLVIDEAHNFAPQGKVPDPDTGRMLHAANTLASGGRSIGVRLVMITQRPQKLHKDALTSADTLIAMRVLAPHDRLAVEDWIKGCGDISTGKEVLNSLAGLKRGEGWVWYPEGGHLARTRFPEIRTFDSSATPTDGHAVKAPKAAAEIDLTEINKALAEAVREAEANDPKRLRARIAELEREAKRQPAASTGAGKAELVAEYTRGQEDGFEAGRAAGWRQALTAVQPAVDRLGTLRSALEEQLDAFGQDIARLIASAPKASPAPARPPSVPVRQMPGTRRARAAGGKGHPELSGPQQRILDAAAFLEDTLGARVPNVVQLALFAGQSASGGYWRANIGRCRSLGLIEGTSLTEAGRAAAQPSTIQTAEQLHEHVFTNLLEGAQKPILKALIDAYPEGLSAEELGRRCNLEPVGGYWRANIGRLRSLGLVTKRGLIAALPVLFLER